MGPRDWLEGLVGGGGDDLGQMEWVRGTGWRDRLAVVVAATEGRWSWSAGRSGGGPGWWRQLKADGAGPAWGALFLVVGRGPPEVCVGGRGGGGGGLLQMKRALRVGWVASAWAGW